MSQRPAAGSLDQAAEGDTVICWKTCPAVATLTTRLEPVTGQDYVLAPVAARED